jgi:hypothetical protein
MGRAKVRSNPACIFIAEEECVIHLYVLSKRMDGDGSIDNPEIIIALDRAPEIPYGDENSPTLPFDRDFPVFMEAEQELWAVSPGESEVTFSALPVPIDVVGY